MLRNDLGGRTRRVVSRVLGSPVVEYIARSASRSRLPVLAYHDVTDPVIFARHLDLIQERYRPVSGAEVATAVRHRARLPGGAIWVTFDDANPGVFAHALPQLANRSVPASLFVCPGVVDTDQPYWWQTIELALSCGHRIEFGGRSWADYSIITHLKTVPDSLRRETVARVADELPVSGARAPAAQATSSDLRRWIDAGLDLGNHTWDHPCLDRCDEKQQRHQIVSADRWLREMFGTEPRLFAYPNGNTAEPSRRVLADLGYSVTALFDHRLGRTSGPEVSRLRIDADAPIERLAAIASGAHPLGYALAQQVRFARASVRPSR